MEEPDELGSVPAPVGVVGTDQCPPPTAAFLDRLALRRHLCHALRECSMAVWTSATCTSTWRPSTCAAKALRTCASSDRTEEPEASTTDTRTRRSSTRTPTTRRPGRYVATAHVP